MINLRHEIKQGIVQVNLDKHRWYEVEQDNGSFNYYPSVTSILDEYPKGYGFKKYLMNLADEAEGKQILNEAGDRGSKVHWGIEQLLNKQELHFIDIPFGFNDSFTAEDWKYILSFINWYEDYKPITLSIEQNIIEPYLEYGGTVDYECIIDGVHCNEPYRNENILIDWKTSSQIHDSYKIQLTAYAYAWPRPIDRIKIVKLGHPYKRGYQIWECKYDEAIETYLPLFKACKTIFDFNHKDDVPRFMECPERLILEEKDAKKRHETENISRSEGKDKDGEKIGKGLPPVAGLL